MLIYIFIHLIKKRNLASCNGVAFSRLKMICYLNLSLLTSRGKLYTLLFFVRTLRLLWANRIYLRVIENLTCRILLAFYTQALDFVLFNFYFCIDVICFRCYFFTVRPVLRHFSAWPFEIISVLTEVE